MSKTRILYLILATLLGLFAIVFGGIDDSPGAQLIGVVIIGVVIFKLIKSRVQNSLKR